MLPLRVIVGLNEQMKSNHDLLRCMASIIDTKPVRLGTARLIITGADYAVLGGIEHRFGRALVLRLPVNCMVDTGDLFLVFERQAVSVLERRDRIAEIVSIRELRGIAKYIVSVKLRSTENQNMSMTERHTKQNDILNVVCGGYVTLPPINRLVFGYIAIGR